jgi:hypothetical protein
VEDQEAKSLTDRIIIIIMHYTNSGKQGARGSGLVLPRLKIAAELLPVAVELEQGARGSGLVLLQYLLLLL